VVVARASDAARVNRQNTTQREPRLFYLVRHSQLVRHSDVSGVSGAGTVAEGVEWSDGSVTLRWRGRWPVTSAWEGGIDAVLAVHGHNGTTEVHWLDGPTVAINNHLPPVEVQVTGVRVPTASADGLCVRCGQAWPCLSCGP
jgi:hypothetical protein